MGEIADMMLDGILDAETGEYIGDRNKELFGDESPGFPVSYEKDHPNNPYNPKNTLLTTGHEEPCTLKTKVQCPFCCKWVKAVGFSDHFRTLHLGEFWTELRRRGRE